MTCLKSKLEVGQNKEALCSPKTMHLVLSDVSSSTQVFKYSDVLFLFPHFPGLSLGHCLLLRTLQQPPDWSSCLLSLHFNPIMMSEDDRIIFLTIGSHHYPNFKVFHGSLKPSSEISTPHG